MTSTAFADVDPGVRRSMRSNRSVDTKPEVRLRSLLHRQDLRFRKHVRPVPSLRCTADVVFPTQRVAVFVDGCFWHCCPDHGTRPKKNGDWWNTKLDRNIERDLRNNDALVAAGWSVLRVWEHQPVDEAASLVQSVVQSNTIEGTR